MEILDKISEVVNKSHLKKWLNRKMPELGGKTPNQIIKAKEEYKILHLVDYIKTGLNSPAKFIEQYEIPLNNDDISIDDLIKQIEKQTKEELELDE